MNDERFFDLAMKVIASQATEAERAELDALLAREPESKAEFERLQADVRIAKVVLPVLSATEAVAGELPGYARGRLQAKVRQTLGRLAAEKEQGRALAAGWRWVLGLAVAAGAVLLVVLPIFRTANAPVIQLAMLDAVGVTRGSGTNDVLLLRETWRTAGLNSFTNAESLRAWEANWSDNQNDVKVIYDRATAEVRVMGKWRGKTFGKTFEVEPDLSATLKAAAAYITGQTQN